VTAVTNDCSTDATEAATLKLPPLVSSATSPI
jgi:hypothetical protein